MSVSQIKPRRSRIVVREEEDETPTLTPLLPAKKATSVKARIRKPVVSSEEDSSSEEELVLRKARVRIREEPVSEELKTEQKVSKVKEEVKTSKSKQKKEPAPRKTKITLIPVGEEVALPELPDELNVFEVATQYTPPGWEEHFTASRSKLQRVSELLLKCKEPYSPDNSNIFRAFQLTRPEDIRVVILGQDPYPGVGVATGLAFSTHPSNPIPKSLLNIFKEITNSIPGHKKPSSGCLDHWALQGVFLINACLTCPVRDARGHGKFGIWKPFVSATLSYIGELNRDCYYLLWGKDAQEYRSEIKTSMPARILTSSHPSPQAAHLGFLGCGHFATVNKGLDPPIRW